MLSILIYSFLLLDIYSTHGSRVPVMRTTAALRSLATKIDGRVSSMHSPPHIASASNHFAIDHNHRNINQPPFHSSNYNALAKMENPMCHSSRVTVMYPPDSYVFQPDPVWTHPTPKPSSDHRQRNRKESVPARQFQVESNIPISFLDDTLDAMRLIELASTRSGEESNEYHRTRHNVVKLINKVETDMQAIVATRVDEESGKVVVTVAIPGVKSATNMRLVRKLRLIPTDMFDDALMWEEEHGDFGSSSDDNDELEVVEKEVTKFPGEESSWWIDLPTTKHSPSDVPHVPKGFAMAFESLRPDIVRTVLKIIQENSIENIEGVNFIGHSLGGVMAVYSSIVTSRLLEPFGHRRPPIRVATIGSPKMGDESFHQRTADLFGWTSSSSSVLHSKDTIVHFSNADDPVVHGHFAGVTVLKNCVYKSAPGHHVNLPVSNPWLDPILNHRQYVYEQEFKEWARDILHPDIRSMPTWLDYWCREARQQTILSFLQFHCRSLRKQAGQT